MAREPVARGEIAEGGAFELLRDLEARRITGSLHFRTPDGAIEGEVALLGGELAVEQKPTEDGKDPVDLLLDCGALSYRVEQRLPPMAVSRGNDFTKNGSLAVHVPADLMNYCEHAGLTGVLELSQDGHKAEALYDGGELVAIELDGDEATDLHEVFGWDKGRFRITLDTTVPERLKSEPPPDEGSVWTGESSTPARGENTQRFLKVVEMALSDVVERSEKARDPTRTSPPIPPLPPKRRRPDSVRPPPKRRDESTVKLVYLSGDTPSTRVDRSTRHVRKGSRAEPALFEASPERRAPEPAPRRAQESLSMAKKKQQQKPPREAAPSEPTEAEEATADAPEPAVASARAESEPTAPGKDAPKKKDAAPEGSVLSNVLWASLWAVTALVIGLMILAVLAQLPPVV